MNRIYLFLLFSLLLHPVLAQNHEHHQPTVNQNINIDAQPLLAQALRLQEALTFSGSTFSPKDIDRLKSLQDLPHNLETVKQIQEILDPYCLHIVNINPESRVKVDMGMAAPKLVQGGWTSFLVKINNEAGVTAKLEVESPNAVRPVHSWSFDSRVKQENIISPGQVTNRFLEVQMYTNRPLQANLSGLKLEYAVVQIFCKDAGKREAEIGYNVGQGSQDIGFRNTIPVLFDVEPSVKVNFQVKDEDGSAAMASFLITSATDHPSGKLTGIYPLPSRRVATFDEYPDFFFQPQIYRQDGEHVLLPAGKYNVSFIRGPEYIRQTKELIMPSGAKEINVSFQLKRWIQLSRLGWYSADHHVHAAGCSHYDSPAEGVEPKDMWRQALGEDLNIAAVLAWGPSWYYQKNFFTGKDNPLSDSKNIIRNDVEVSGFPSSHAGHIVLLRIKEDDYPGTTKIEQWPTWTLPVLSWAKSQNGITGYAHSGWGLEPVQPTDQLPNYITPKMDGIGANEYVVTVTQNVIDFYSAGDTPAPWELNMWYHTLNCGFKTRLSGETDFPCITDARVGLARSYFKSDGPLNYDTYVESLQKGRSYVSDGKSHIMDFTVNGQESGVGSSELNLKGKQKLTISAKIASYLPEQQDEAGELIAKTSITKTPYWDIERARIGKTRKVGIELIINGVPVDTTEINADGEVKDVSFSYSMTRSGWVALRIYPSSHSNPVFIKIDDKPIQEKRSAEWCLEALNQCWKMKEPNIRKEEKAAAEKAYEDARKIYHKIIANDSK